MSELIEKTLYEKLCETFPNHGCMVLEELIKRVADRVSVVDRW